MSGDGRTPTPAPPWSQVIATTIRLWWQRRVRAPSGRPATGYSAVRRLGLAALVVALAAATATAVDLAVSRDGTATRTLSQRRDPQAQRTGSSALAAANASRQQAAAWVAAQVGHDVIIACDPLMCGALQQDGFPAASLESIGSATGDPLGSGIVMSTAAIRALFGTRLKGVYAPDVIASFGTGPSQVQVLVTAPGGATAYQTAELADVSARKTGGLSLLGNRNIVASPTARTQLASGQVDSRLLITLAALAHRYPVVIRGFGDAGPGAAPGTPLRSAVLSTRPGYLTAAMAFLRAQRAPLLATTTEYRIGQTTVLDIEFSAPSPIGLLSTK